jgi:AmmeMemoRadiSam system protein A
MQELVFTGLVPHPPILIPAVGADESKEVLQTRQALERLSSELVARRAQTLVLLTPHGPVFQDAIAVHMLPTVSGSLADFGAPGIVVDMPIDTDLGQLMVDAAQKDGLSIAPVTEEWAVEWQAEELDHGSVVPLYFLQQAGWRGKLLPISVGMLPPIELYALGMALQRAIDQSGLRVAVLASGDLSHRLPEPSAEGFDREIVRLLGDGDFAQLFRLEQEKCEKAASCALRPLYMMAGLLDGIGVQATVHSYEGPFEVGYAVASLVPDRPDPERRMLDRLKLERLDRIKHRRQLAHPAVTLARLALEHYVQTGMELDYSAGAPHAGTAPWRLPADMPERLGVFVSIRLDGELRGCIGSVEPTEPSLFLEIVRMAIGAGTGDPRFLPVEEADLPFLDYSVDLIGPLEPATATQLDPAVYGIVVLKDDQMGVLLPAIPGIQRPDQQVSLACDKAGLDPQDLKISIKRFRTQHLT